MFDGFSSVVVVVDHIHGSLTAGSFIYVARNSKQTARFIYYALSLNSGDNEGLVLCYDRYWKDVFHLSQC